jgi:hypothetical protein
MESLFTKQLLSKNAGRLRPGTGDCGPGQQQIVISRRLQELLSRACDQLCRRIQHWATEGTCEGALVKEFVDAHANDNLFFHDEKSIIDMSVYSRNRLLRTPLSSKHFYLVSLASSNQETKPYSRKSREYTKETLKVYTWTKSIGEHKHKPNRSCYRTRAYIQKHMRHTNTACGTQEDRR